MPRTRRPTRIPRRGMTLIEVLMALVILTGALLGMGRFITGFSHATSDSTLTSTAADLVLDRLEYVKAAKPYPNLPAYAVTEATVPGYPNFRRVTQVRRTNTAQFDYTAITVTVSHPSLPNAVKKSTIVASF
jgi:prepilin-type N-terminal cleavage/methylation domain-containing protein